MISAAYAGSRVIEIASTLSAGVTGRCFADLGADVVRVEELEQLAMDPGERAVQTWARARKRVLAPRPRGQLGVRDIDALLPDADVVITDLRPSRWAETFPALDALVDAHPHLVVVDVTRFGRIGPYVDYLAPDLVVLALSGYLFMCGLNDREPLRLGVDVVDVMTGVNAAGGAMLGLHHARRTGQGQVVEVSALRTMLCSTMSFATSYSSQGIVRRRSATRMVSVGIMLPCKDGHALVNTFRTPSEILYVLLEDERLLDDRFADVIGREMHQQAMAEIMVEAAANRTMWQLFEAGQELRLQNAMVQSPLQTPSDAQHAVRRFFRPLVLANGTTVPAPVPPLVPVEARDERMHRSGETIAAVDSGTWRQRPIPRHVEASPSREALDGLKVLELTFAWAGPLMGRILADHGARVVKIESRKYVDTAKGGADLVDRSFGENGRWMDRSTSYIVANPAKYHLGMELTDPRGREVLLDLVRWADVVIENFTPRVLPNLGLGWDVFRSANPSVIMISASGFGQHGPYRDYGAWGWGLECQAGITAMTGYPDDPSPFLFMPTIPDPLSAMVGVAAILAAVEERRRTGHGQRIDLSQYECATFATLVETLRAAEAGVDRPRTGNRHAWKGPQGVYPCRGADAWVAVAVETDEQWFRLCAAIDRRDLAADEQLRTHRGRHGQRRVDDAISAWTRERSKHDAMQVLQRAGVPAGAVQHAKDLQEDPQLQALEYYRAAWGSEIGLRIWPGTWYGMQATPGDIRRGTSTFGEDNVRVLRDLLGYDDDTVAALLATEAFSERQDSMEQPATPGLPVATMLEQGTILSWDSDYRVLPQQVAESNQSWRREHGLPEIRLDGRDD